MKGWTQYRLHVQIPAPDKCEYYELGRLTMEGQNARPNVELDLIVR